MIQTGMWWHKATGEAVDVHSIVTRHSPDMRPECKVHFKYIGSTVSYSYPLEMFKKDFHQ